MLRAPLETALRGKSVLSSLFVLSKASSRAIPRSVGETEARKHDHLGPGSWLPSLGQCTLLAALATPEQVRGSLATSPFSGAKNERGRRGRGCGWVCVCVCVCMCTLGGGGATALPGSRRRGGCDKERGGDAPGSGRGCSSVSRGRAARTLRASRARAPSPLLALSLAFSIAPSLPPSLLPGGRGGAGKAAKRSGRALEECGSAEGAEADAFSPRFEQPEPRRPDPARGKPRTRAAGGNRNRESREGRDARKGARQAHG